MLKEIQEKLLSLDATGMTEKKPTGYGQNAKELTYLSWAHAWKEFIKIYPEATYEIVKDENSMPYFENSKGAMVYTKVTVENITREMWLPIMDSNNNAMKSESYSYTTKYGTKQVEAFDMFDVNKTIMRCLTKNLAMFGLGTYIYAGEDMPDVVPEGKEIGNTTITPKSEAVKKETPKKEAKKEQPKPEVVQPEVTEEKIDHSKGKTLAECKETLLKNQPLQEWLKKNNKTLDTVTEVKVREWYNSFIEKGGK